MWSAFQVFYGDLSLFAQITIAGLIVAIVAIGVWSFCCWVDDRLTRWWAPIDRSPTSYRDAGAPRISPTLLARTDRCGGSGDGSRLSPAATDGGARGLDRRPTAFTGDQHPPSTAACTSLSDENGYVGTRLTVIP